MDSRKTRQRDAVDYGRNYDKRQNWAFKMVLENYVLGESISSADTVLDIGCGNGANIKHLSKGKSYYGLDISSAIINEARRKYKQAGYIQGDAENLPFADSAIDVTVSYCTLHHLPKPMVGLTEAVRVAKKKVIVVEPMLPRLKSVILFYKIILWPAVKLMRAYRALKGIPSKSMDDIHPGHPGYRYLQDYEAIINQNRWEAKIGTVKFGLIHEQLLFNRVCLCRLIYRLDKLLDKLPLFRHRGTMMILEIYKNGHSL